MHRRCVKLCLYVFYVLFYYSFVNSSCPFWGMQAAVSFKHWNHVFKSHLRPGCMRVGYFLYLHCHLWVENFRYAETSPKNINTYLLTRFTKPKNRNPSLTLGLPPWMWMDWWVGGWKDRWRRGMVDSAYNRFNSPWKITRHANISEHEYTREETCGTDDR